jgi:hypothetical protein
VAPTFVRLEGHIPVPSDSKQPGSEGPLLGAESPDPPGRRDKGLLRRLFGQFPPACGQREAEAVDSIEM